MAGRILGDRGEVAPSYGGGSTGRLGFEIGKNDFGNYKENKKKKKEEEDRLKTRLADRVEKINQSTRASNNGNAISTDNLTDKTKQLVAEAQKVQQQAPIRSPEVQAQRDAEIKEQSKFSAFVRQGDKTPEVPTSTIETDPTKFTDQFRKTDKNTQTAYVNGVKKLISNTEEKYGKSYDEYKKKGLSDEEAKSKASEVVGDDYYTAQNTLKTLTANGIMKGDIGDFIQASNDRLLGGIGREAIRLGGFAGRITGQEMFKPENVDKFIKKAGLEQQENVSDFGKAGQIAGEVQKTGFDMAQLIVGAGTANALTKGSNLVKGSQIAKTGFKLAPEYAKVASKVLPAVAGSATGTAIGAVQDIGNGREQDLTKNILIGTAADILLPGAGKVIGALNKGGGKAIAKTASTISPAMAQAKINRIASRGVVGGIDDLLSSGIKKVGSATENVLEKTKAGSKVVQMKDDFLTHWVSEFNPVYKILSKSDAAGKTVGAQEAAREAIGSSNRALSYSTDFIEHNPNIAKTTAGIQAKAKTNDLVAARNSFDEYAKVKSELDLAKAGKKTFSKERLAELESRMAKADDFEDEYQGLVDYYKDVNDFRLKEGLISQEEYDRFADEGYDYVRQQREIDDWKLDRPGGKVSGSKASISKSEAIQKRNEFADQELLSPLETAIATTQKAHIEAYRNRAAKTIYGLLDEAGETKILRSTESIREKQALLKNLKETKPIATKLNRAIRTNKNAANAIKKEMTQLNSKGRKELSKKFKEALDDFNIKADAKPDAPVDVHATMEMLMTLDSTELRKVRRMLGARNSKLSPLLDTIEVLNRNLDDLHKNRSDVWQAAQGIKTSVDKSKQGTLSFLYDGEENIFSVDPTVEAAVKNWNKQQQNILGNTLQLTNNIFKFGTTGLNAGFALPNFLADQVSSGINSKNLWQTHNPGNFIRSVAMTLGHPLGKEDAEILRLYEMGNKSALSINQYTKTNTARQAANSLVRQNAAKKQKAFTLIKNPREGMRTLFEGLENTIGYTENLTRAQNFRGMYNAAKKQGLAGDELTKAANLGARENSVDFLEMGNYGRVVNSFIPYFNASIQGSRTLLRAAGERPASFTAKVTALVSVPTLATTIWNTSDPDRKAVYDTIPDYIKENNFVVVTPTASWDEKNKVWKGVFILKKPPGYRNLAEPIRQYVEYKADKGESGDFADFFKEEAGTLAGDLSLSVSPLDLSSPGKFLSSVTPQLLKPTAESIVNRDFYTNEPIVGESLQKLPAEDQKYENYSKLTSYIGGIFGVAPLQVDHWIKQTFGEVGTNAVNAIDSISGAPEEARGGRSMGESIMRRFMNVPGGEDNTQFYTVKDNVNKQRTQTNNRINKLIEQGDRNKAERLAEEYNKTVEGYFTTVLKRFSSDKDKLKDWQEQIKDLKFGNLNYKSREESIKKKNK